MSKTMLCKIHKGILSLEKKKKDGKSPDGMGKDKSL